MTDTPAAVKALVTPPAERRLLHSGPNRLERRHGRR
jgi:hypothetical protein